MKNADEYLEPEDSLFTGIFMPEYFAMVISALKGAYKKDVKVRVLVFPSSSPEYAVGIRENSEIFTIFKLSLVLQLWGYLSVKMMRAEPPEVIKNGKYGSYEELIKELEEEYPEDYRDIKLERCEIQINSDLAKSIIEIWKKMLLQTRYVRNRGFGLDGTGYHFSMSIGHQKFAGKTWSPSPEYKTGKLVAISDLMAEICMDDNIKIKNKLKSLVNELKDQLLDYE